MFLFVRLECCLRCVISILFIQRVLLCMESTPVSAPETPEMTGAGSVIGDRLIVKLERAGLFSPQFSFLHKVLFWTIDHRRVIFTAADCFSDDIEQSTRSAIEQSTIYRTSVKHVFSHERTFFQIWLLGAKFKTSQSRTRIAFRSPLFSRTDPRLQRQEAAKNNRV